MMMMMMITIMAVVSVGLPKRKVDGDVCDGLCVTLGVCVIPKAFSETWKKRAVILPSQSPCPAS